MSAVKFELEYLCPEGFRHDHVSSSDFTLTCLTELSANSGQLDHLRSRSAPDGKLIIASIFLSNLNLNSIYCSEKSKF